MDVQREVVAFLCDPRSYGGGGAGAVERIETHISLVFLVGDRAFKLKRAVKLPYVDFSTVARRRTACAKEVRFNRRTAPSLYLGVRALRRTAQGGVSFDGRGAAIDWVVEMRRFDQQTLFDRMTARGALTPALVRDLADEVAAFHAAAEPNLRHGGARGIRRVIRGDAASFAALRPGGLDRDAVRALQADCAAALAANAALLDRRRAEGHVRHCHGDLHLRNICLVEGRPTLFDCIEFDRDLAVIDVAYDLAFLLMDLEHRGARPLASVAFNRTLDMTGDESCLGALPLFLALRAAIRAHVTALTAQNGAGGGRPIEEARAYLALGRRCLEPARPRLVAIGGASGSGKSTLAAGIGPWLGRAPGARVLRSDVVRKRLFGIAPEIRLPRDAYGESVGERVYAALRERAAAALASGFSVVVDAVHARQAERTAIAAVARAAGVKFDGIWLDVPRETLSGRLDARRDDPSDATAAVLDQQLKRGFGAVTWTRFDASRSPEDCVAAARRALGL